MDNRHLDWDAAIATVRESGTDYLVPPSGEGNAIWEDEWQRAVLARRLSWKARGWEMYAACSRTQATTSCEGVG
jgi:hypothetical protein